MTNLLKTFLHLLSIVVLCTAIAACTPATGGATYTGGESFPNFTAPSSSIMDE